MKKIFILIFTYIFILNNYESSAQVYTGGSIGMHYEDGFYIDAAPLLGYRYGILDAGISPFYSYREYEKKPSTYAYGNRIFAQITFIPNVFVHGEFEVSNVATSVIGTDGKRQRKWIMGLPVGGGYRYNLSARTQAYGMILYDLVLDKDSPVKNPIIRGGVVYKF